MAEEVKKRLQESYAFAKKDNYEEALKLCNEVIRDHPMRLEGFRTRADIYGRMGDYASESENLHKLVALGSKEPCDYYALGQAELLNGNLESAVEALTKAIKLGDEYKNTYYSGASSFLRAEAFLRMKRYEDALADCDQLKEDYSYYLPSGMKTRVEIIRHAKTELAKTSKKKWSFSNCDKQKKPKDGE